MPQGQMIQGCPLGHMDREVLKEMDPGTLLEQMDTEMPLGQME